MSRPGPMLALCGLVLQPAPARAAEPVLEPGAYTVAVRLELPHLADMAGTATRRLCLDDSATHGMAILSENNPLARCPVSNVQAAGDELGFDIRCEGRNAAQASARYRLSRDRFTGRITMRMGGKNMTMTEVQSGRRTGPCAEGEGPDKGPVEAPLEAPRP